MTWFAAFLALLVSHAVGDVLLQTDWQAVNKVRGLGDPLARRALAAHIATYTAAFVPATGELRLEDCAFFDEQCAGAFGSMNLM